MRGEEVLLGPFRSVWAVLYGPELAEWEVRAAAVCLSVYLAFVVAVLCCTRFLAWAGQVE